MSAKENPLFSVEVVTCDDFPSRCGGNENVLKQDNRRHFPSYKKTGKETTPVSQQEARELIRLGAADSRRTQMIRIRPDGLSHSAVCRKCRKAIVCGLSACPPYEAECQCGQEYRVVSDDQLGVKTTP